MPEIFLTEIQKIVVLARIKDGYSWQLVSNGNYKLWKGRHIMEINCLGYDCFIKLGNYRM